MIEIHGAQTVDGGRMDHFIPSARPLLIDAKKLFLFPALIDPHVHFPIASQPHKEDWGTAAAACLAGGITTIFDMPNNIPPTVTKERLLEKKRLIDAQLSAAKIPLRYHLYLGADQEHLHEINDVKDLVIGIKIFMGSSTGDLLLNDPKSLDKAFDLAAKAGLIVAVHAEHEGRIRMRKEQFAQRTDVAVHSQIRDEEVARRAVAQAIELAAKHRTRLYLVHVSTKAEIDLVRQAKKNGLPVYAEATPHHLFLTEEAYATQGARVQTNPPIRSQEHQEALWNAIENDWIDTVGSDHTPHTLEEKAQAYPYCPSGVPGVENTLSLLLTAYSQGKIGLEKIISLTHTRTREIFRLPPNDDVILVDLEKEFVVQSEQQKTQVRWSPYEGQILRGKTVFTVLRGKVYEQATTAL